MGRAQGQRHATGTSTVTGFEAVLGARRGPGLAAQAQRDRDEQAQRVIDEERGHTLAFEAFADNVSAASGFNATVETLAHIYEARSNPKRCLPLIVKLSSGIDMHKLQEMIAIAALGDPLSWSGLTAPAVRVLGRHFADPGLINADATIVRGLAYRAAEDCFGKGPYAPAHYLRLQPLSEGLGTFLAGQTKEGGRELGQLMGFTLTRAETETLAGPLASWLNAFAQRHDAGHLSVDEHNVLQGLFQSSSDDAERQLVLAPLRERIPSRLPPT